MRRLVPEVQMAAARESSDVSGQSVRTRLPGTDCKFNGGSSRNVAILVRRE